jgi:hypothetical protein
MAARPAEWQWSVPVESATSPETDDHPRAFLWIPPDCRRVRGAIVGQHNMIEEGILEHPALRKALAETGMAAVWVSPPFDGTFRFDRGAGGHFFDRGAGGHFEKMMAALAEESVMRPAGAGVPHLPGMLSQSRVK